MALFPMGADLVDFVVLQPDRSADENPRDDPHGREDQHAEDEPGQREAGDTRRHDLRMKIVQQGQTEENDEERGGAADGELELSAHERAQKFFAMHPVVVRRGGRHEGGSLRASEESASPEKPC